MKKHLNKSKLLLGGLISMIIILAILQIVVANLFSTDGANFSNIQTKIVAIKEENIFLKQDIDTEGSLHTIASKAATLGFTIPQNTISVQDNFPLAIRE